MNGTQSYFSAKALLFSGLLLSAGGANATAVGSLDIVFDWSTLSVSGPLTTPTAVSIPDLGISNLSSSTDAWVGDDYNPSLASDSQMNGADTLASHITPVHTLRGGYDSATNSVFGNALVTNDGLGIQSGYAGGYRGLFYQATGNGSVTVSVDYTLSGSVSTDLNTDYVNLGYEVLGDAINANEWIANFNSAFSSNGGDAVAASASADALTPLLDSIPANWQVLLQCSGPTPCTANSAPGAGGTASLTFGVTSGNVYNFGFEGTASAYSVTAVPVPAAVWLFGSGLAGLVAVARRKSAA